MSVIPPRNVYYMLSYAFRALEWQEDAKIGGDAFDNIHNLFAAILGKGISQLLKQGVHREYLAQVDDLPMLRGKVDMSGTIRNRMACRRLICCEYDELTEDNLFNRILKTTALLLIHHKGVGAEYRHALQKYMLFFSAVGTERAPSRIAWSTIRFQRGNRNYRMLLGVCRFILDGLLLTTEKGEHHLASFADDQRMHRLYEKFILEFYRRECSELNPCASHIPWALDDDMDVLLPTMKSDIMLRCGTHTLIIDAKYYGASLQGHYNTAAQRSDNLYQLFAYVKNQAASHREQMVSGMLLYAKTTETMQPDAEYSMSGNRICVRTLDLGAEFESIKASLLEIARSFADSASGTQTPVSDSRKA